jgi:hypothetical protein
MSFPEWGFSYNALCVPLTSDWQCLLVPGRDMQDVDPGRTRSHEERQKARKEREKQIEQDQQDFDRLFRVLTDRVAARSCSDFSTYVTFINEQLRLSGLPVPADGDSLTRILRKAVHDGHLVPAIHREWRGSRRVTRFYAPQSWPKREPDPMPTVYGFRNGQLVPLDANGRIIEHTPYVPVRMAARAAATASTVGRTSGGGSGFDWLGTAEAVVGSAPSVMRPGNDSGDDLMRNTFAAASDSDGNGLFSDAQPFEYQPGAIDDNVMELAARGVSEAQEAECDAMYEARMTYCSALSKLYGGDARTYLACREQAFQDYQACRGYL